MCFDWFGIARSNNLPMYGPIVKAKAKEIAEKINYHGFLTSNGWLQKWRKWRIISLKCLSGEAASIILENVTQFKTKLPSVLNKYKPEDIYNVDESGLLS